MQVTRWLLFALLLLGGQIPPARAHSMSALHNSFVQISTQKTLKIVAIGNSVTHGSPFGGAANVSFYVALRDWLQRKFPDAKIELKTAIIFAIGPEIQLFRMDEKVIAEKPDLVLVEFGAANGAWGEAGREITDHATEGFVRRLRFLLPQTDCLMNLGLFRTMMTQYEVGKTPHSASFQIQIAKHYNCALADSGKAIAQRVLAGESWETFMKDAIHPGEKGYALHSQTLVAELERQFALFEQEKSRDLVSHAFPAATVHPDPWLFPRLIPAYFAEKTSDFVIGENGRVKFLSADRAGASGAFTSGKGQVVGILMREAKGEIGNLEVQDPGGRWVRLSQRKEPHFSEGNDPENRFYRNFFGAYGLPLYLAEVKFRVSAQPEVPGAYRVQIAGFLVIEREADIPFVRGQASPKLK